MFYPVCPKMGTCLGPIFNIDCICRLLCSTSCFGAVYPLRCSEADKEIVTALHIIMMGLPFSKYIILIYLFLDYQGSHPKDGEPVILKLAQVGFCVRHRRTIASVPKVCMYIKFRMKG